jgi:hypothetical protein
MNQTEADVIAEHALEDEHNLKMAAKVGLAFPTLKARIIRTFITSLVTTLKARLGDSWEISDDWSAKPLKGSVCVSKESWTDEFWIGLAAEKTGPSELDWFVWTETTISLQTPLVAAIKGALDDGFCSGRSTNNNPWWQYLARPYRDWNTEDSLLWLWKKEDAVRYCADHIVKMCEIVSPILESMKNKRR